MKKIYSFFKRYSKEEIDMVIDELDEKEKKLLIHIYGNDLENPDKNIELTNDEKIQFENLIVKMREQIKVVHKMKKVKTIYQIFSMYEESEIDYVLEGLTLNESDILFLRFGSDLRHPNVTNWDNCYIRELNAIYKKMEKILKARRQQYLKNKQEIVVLDSSSFLDHSLTFNYNNANPMLLKELDNVLNHLKNPKYENLLTMFSLKELVVYLLVQNINNDNYTLYDIANLLETTPKELVNITSGMLRLYIYNKANLFDIGGEDEKISNNL